MIDLHTHTMFSDGELLPMELTQHYISKGYKGIAISDHVDYSNVDFVVDSLYKAVKELKKSLKDFFVVPGVEITHVPPNLIKYLVDYVREKGIKLVICHGETIVEPVAQGTNRASVEADIDILAHPGLIDEGLVEICRQKNIFLEITSRKGHSLTNGHVAQVAKKIGAKLVINNDSHLPSDILLPQQLRKIGMGCGLSGQEVEEIFSREKEFVEKIV